MKHLLKSPSPFLFASFAALAVWTTLAGCFNAGAAPTAPPIAPTAVAASTATVSSPSAGAAPAPKATPLPTVPAVRRLKWRVVASYPHDAKAFTQGLLWHDGGFYESTGLEGRSSVRRVEFPSGRVVKKASLSSDLFGEGLTLMGDRLINLTWQTRRGLVFDRASLRLLREFSYATEGWGLTNDGRDLIMSDGTSTLSYLDANTFKPLRRMAVTQNGQPLRMLNELEWIDGQIWANVWETNIIAQIDPASGRVVSTLDLTGILPPQAKKGGEDVLNGIAYDAQTKRVFVTGKLWPRLFHIAVE